MVVSLPVGEVGFGRAVSRFLSAPLRTERIICLSSQYPKPVLLAQTLGRAAPDGFLFGLAPDGVFRAASLALRAVRSYRTFSPLPALLAKRGRSNFLWHFPLESFSTFPPRVSPAKPELRGIAPGGVRTFLPRLAPEAILRPSKTSATLAAAAATDKQSCKYRLMEPTGIII